MLVVGVGLRRRSPALSDVRFGAHHGLKSDIAPSPKSAKEPTSATNIRRLTTLFPLSRHSSQLLQSEHAGSRRSTVRATFLRPVRSRCHRPIDYRPSFRLIERPHGKDAVAQLFRNLIHFIVGLIAFTHKNRKPHPIR